jgi:hypothetical protein
MNHWHGVEELARQRQDDFRREATKSRLLTAARSGEPGAARPALSARLAAAIRNVVRSDHSLTDYPCRLPDGRMGRVAVVQDHGDWTMVCRVARPGWGAPG